MDCDTGTPACRAAPMAASAFSALCAPNRFHFTVPSGLAAFEHHELGEVAAIFHVERPLLRWPGARANPSSGVHAPMASVAFRFSSPAFQRMRPEAGTVRTR